MKGMISWFAKNSVAANLLMVLIIVVSRNQVVDVAVAGDVDEFTLKETADRIRDEISAIPRISQVEITSAKPYEIAIEDGLAVDLWGAVLRNRLTATPMDSGDLAFRLGKRLLPFSCPPRATTPGTDRQLAACSGVAQSFA